MLYLKYGYLFIFFHKNSKFNNVFKHVTFTYMHLYKDICNVSDFNTRIGA